MMNRGKVSGKGIMPPEACINPNEFLALLSEVMDLDSKKDYDDSFSGFIAESVDEKGNVIKIDI